MIPNPRYKDWGFPLYIRSRVGFVQKYHRTTLHRRLWLVHANTGRPQDMETTGWWELLLGPFIHKPQA